MAEEFDVEAMLEAPYMKEVIFRAINVILNTVIVCLLRNCGENAAICSQNQRWLKFPTVH